MADVTLKKKAHDLLQKGKLDSALRAFKLLLKEDPEEASIHNSTGDVLLKMDRDEEALEEFIKAAELYLRDGLHMVAISVSRKALRVNPKLGAAHYLMGRCFCEQDKDDQAARSLVEFLKTKPDKKDPRVLSALKMLTGVDPQEDGWVIKLAKLAFLRKDLGTMDQCLSLAAERNLKQQNKISKMLQQLRQDLGAASSEPEPVAAAEETVEAEEPEVEEEEFEIPEETVEVTHDTRDLGEPASEEELEGLEEFQIGSEQAEEVPKRKRLGEYLVTDDLLKADDVLKALEVQSSSGEDTRLGDVLVDMGMVSRRQVREALSRQISDMKKRLEKTPDDPLGYVELGNLLLDVGDFYGAVEFYLRAASIYRSSGREKMVFELLEGVLDICPESLAAARELARIRNYFGHEGQARALYRLAVAYLLNDSPHESLAALEASLDADPDFEMAGQLFKGIRPGIAGMNGYADIASILADIDKMFDSNSAKALADLIREFQDGIDSAVSPDDFNTHYDLGIAYHEMGLLREAVNELEKVLASPSHRLKSREMLGRCYLRMQRFDESEEQFHKGLSLAADNHEALIGFHLQLAKVYAVTGRKHQAEQELEAARKIDPILVRLQDVLE
ncbi:tetratricopeptide repeat protein [Candidatus Fermentibacteria bacterium]|nr:tetratricopeptide repeat protein [Candidatus Fermentibacteria bacterium]